MANKIDIIVLRAELEQAFEAFKQPGVQTHFPHFSSSFFQRCAFKNGEIIDDHLRGTYSGTYQKICHLFNDYPLSAHQDATPLEFAICLLITDMDLQRRMISFLPPIPVSRLVESFATYYSSSNARILFPRYNIAFLENAEILIDGNVRRNANGGTYRDIIQYFYNNSPANPKDRLSEDKIEHFIHLLIGEPHLRQAMLQAHRGEPWTHPTQLVPRPLSILKDLSDQELREKIDELKVRQKLHSYYMRSSPGTRSALALRTPAPPLPPQTQSRIQTH